MGFFHAINMDGDAERQRTSQKIDAVSEFLRKRRQLRLLRVKVQKDQ
jgi:hypothetical protein